MKKFIEEFKSFALRGNVVDLAIGVLIGGAFSALVTSFTETIIQPILNCIGSTEVGFKIHLLGENYMDIGGFISAIINFFILALVIFIIMKSLNKLATIGQKPAEEAAPTTKVCPFCKSEISIEATRCPHCTSELEEA